MPAQGNPVRRRRFELDTHGGMMGGGMGRGGMGGMGMMTINGRAFDMARIDHRVRRGDTELWEVVANDMAHPFHVHGASFQVLSHNGAPVEFASSGWKDTVLVDGRAQLLLRFGHTANDTAPYMFHCHILEHEDAGMMGQFVVT
jgi:FtsP/CotA-like multicopper oxidase with cupredoxin domain